MEIEAGNPAPGQNPAVDTGTDPPENVRTDGEPFVQTPLSVVGADGESVIVQRPLITVNRTPFWGIVSVAVVNDVAASDHAPYAPDDVAVALTGVPNGTSARHGANENGQSEAVPPDADVIPENAEAVHSSAIPAPNVVVTVAVPARAVFPGVNTAADVALAPTPHTSAVTAAVDVIREIRFIETTP